MDSIEMERNRSLLTTIVEKSNKWEDKTEAYGDDEFLGNVNVAESGQYPVSARQANLLHIATQEIDQFDISTSPKHRNRQSLANKGIEERIYAFSYKAHTFMSPKLFRT